MPARVRLTDAAVGKLQARPAEYTVWDTRMAGLGVRVRPTGSRSYVYLGPCHGGARGPRKHTLGPTTTLSADDARRACLDLQTGPRAESARAAANAGPPMLFRVFVATEWAPAFRDRYKPSVRKGVDAALRRQLLPAFGADPLHRILPQDVHRWFDRYSATAPGGANWTLRLLRSILRHAVRRALLQSDPTRTVRPNPRPRHTRFLSRDEIRILHQHLDASVAERPSCAPQADIIRLLLFTGCRRSEIVNLRWDEVHGDTLQLRDSKTGPKPVYLNAAAQRVLAQQPRPASTYVFPSPLAPARPRSQSLCLWYRVRRQAGLRDVRLHDLRHTFASQAVLQGIPIPVVARLLGHRNVAMTFRYAHVRDRDIETAAERIGTAIQTLLQPDSDRPELRPDL